jgi:hypothetical protein
VKNALFILAGIILIAVGLGLYLFRNDSRASVSPPPIVEPDIPPDPRPPAPVFHPWNGFPVGSWAVVQTSQVRDNVSTTTREKYTVAEIRPDGPVLGFRKAVGDTFEEPGALLKPNCGSLVEAQTQWKASEPTTEKLEIGGKPQECRVTVYFYENPEKKILNRVAVWRSTVIKVPYRQLQRNGPDVALPPDVLRIEFHVQADDQYQKYDFRVTSLEAPIKVGDRDIPCVVEEGTVDVLRKGVATKGRLKRWLSDAVPGRVVKSEYAGEEAGKPVERTETMLSFEVKK